MSSIGAGLVIETRSLPNLLVATLATLPSISEIPFLDSRERSWLVALSSASPDRQTCFWNLTPWLADRSRALCAHRNNPAHPRPDRTCPRGSWQLLDQPAIFSYVSISARVDLLTLIIRIVA